MGCLVTDQRRVSSRRRIRRCLAQTGIKPGKGEALHHVVLESGRLVYVWCR